MPGLPPSNTARVYVDYLVGGEEHTMTLRYPEDGSPVTTLSTVAELFAFLDPTLYTTDIIGARQSDINSNVTNPISWPGSASYGSLNPPAGQQMKFFSMVGKDHNGRRWRLEWFGTNLTIPATWRMTVGTNSDMDDMRDHLQTALASGAICSIAGLPVLMRSYYNFKYADHEIAKLRI